MANIIGTGPENIPLNQFLGTGAFVDAESTSAFVRNRSNHTGVQEQSTVNGLVPRLENIETDLTNLSEIVETALTDVGTQVYTTSQTISKTMFGSAIYVMVELWSGGASGAAVWGGGEASGGEGGAWDWCIMLVKDLPETSTLIIGGGGASVSASNGNTPLFGIQGGKSSFLGFEVEGGYPSTDNFAGAHCLFSGWTGGWGAGPGATNANAIERVRPYGGPGGSSTRGGGGGGSSNGRPPGNSLFGGDGGAGAFLSGTGSASSGQAPSGGGGGANGGTTGSIITSGAGANGQARLTWW